jgi:hypothetical protein
MTDPADLYLKNFEASVKDGTFKQSLAMERFDYDPLPAIEDIRNPQPEAMPMEAIPPMPMEQERPPVEIAATPIVQGNQLGANVNANAPVGDGNFNVNANLVPGNSNANMNYSQPLGRGNLDVNAAVGRGGVQNIGVGYGQPVGNAYLAADGQYGPGRGVDVGVNYSSRDGGIGLRYQPKNNAVMLNATKRF